MKELSRLSRLDFEKYLETLDKNRDFKFDEEFVALASNYQECLMFDYGFDFKSFFYDFFVNSRKTNGYKVPDWYVRVIDSFQDFLTKSEIATALDNLMNAKITIKKMKDELVSLEKNFKFLTTKNSRDFQAKRDYEDSLRICNGILEENKKKEALSFNFLSKQFSEEEIKFAEENVGILVANEAEKVNKALDGKEVSSDYSVLSNPILRNIYERKRAIAVCSGNFFGKSFLLATVSIWAMLCHSNIIVCSVVNADARKSQIKNDLLTQINEYMDGITLPNGINSTIFLYLFHHNVEEVFKVDMREKNYKVSAQKYGDTWRWYTKYARNALDTKGQRPNKFLMIYDEASEIEDGTITGSLTNLKRDLSSLTFVFLCGNANVVTGKPLNEFVKYINSPDKYKKYVDVFHLKASDLDLSILGSNQFVNYIVDTEGVNSPIFKERVMGLFIDTDCLVMRDELDKIFTQEYEPVNSFSLISGCDTAWFTLQMLIRGEETVWVGLDPAGYGKDSFGICIRGRKKILSCFTVNYKEGNPFAKLLQNIWDCRRNHYHIKFIIEINGNASIVDYLCATTTIPHYAFTKFYGHGYSEAYTSLDERNDCSSNYAILAKRRMCAWLKGKKLYKNDELKEQIAGMKLVKPETSQKKSKIDKERFKSSYRKSPDLFDSFVHSFLLQRDYDILGKRYDTITILRKEKIIF